MKKLLVNILLLIAALALTACSKESSESTTAKDGSTELKEVKIGYPTAGSEYIGGIAGYAQEKGYLDEALKEAGYKITYVPFAGAGPAVNDAIVAEDVDVVIYADFPGIVLKSKGIAIDLLGVMSEEQNAEIIVKGDSGITSLKDLKGKKIGFPKGTYVQKYLLEALESVGLSEDDVELINMTSEAQSALLTGSIDALAYVDALTAKLTYTEDNLKVISSTRDNEKWGGSLVFVGRDKYLKANPDVATAMFKAFLKAKDAAKANPDDYYQVTADKTSMPIEAVKHLADLDNGAFDYVTLEIQDDALDKLVSAKKFLLNTQLISDDFDVDAWVDNSYYKKALEEYNK